MHYPITISVIIVSLLSLIGAVTLAVKKKLLEKWMLYFVAFAAGTMLGAAFFDILPETVHELGETGLAYALGGIILFFIIERYIFWHHCHMHSHDIKPYTYLNLVGDATHNFVDGAIISAAYLTNFELGLITTIAIALHEIPQELGDFAILVHGGLAPQKALIFNFITAATALLGAGVTYFLATAVESILPYIVAVAGGGFIYIAATDLFPELHGEENFKKLTMQTGLMLLGIVLVYLITFKIGLGH